MSEPCTQLLNLLETGALTQVHQRTGERLLKRLQSDISVVLAGTATLAIQFVQQVLITSELPRTSFRVVDLQTPFDFARADVCIWCTTEFGQAEAEIWQNAPDWLKDHSFLVAVSDIGPTSRQMGRATLDALDDIAAEEFYGLFPIAFTEGMTDAGASDVDALVREVANLVQTGLRADADNAEMFIQKHQSKLTAQHVRVLDAPPQRTKPVSVPIAVPAHQITPVKQPALIAVYESALSTLRGHLANLDPLMKAQEDTEINDILTICAETSEAVADVLSGTDVDDPDFALLLEEALTVADKILLMSVEGGVAPAVDAVTCVLQLRREMELRIAC